MITAEQLKDNLDHMNRYGCCCDFNMDDFKLLIESKRKHNPAYSELTDYEIMALSLKQRFNEATNGLAEVYFDKDKANINFTPVDGTNLLRFSSTLK